MWSSSGRAEAAQERITDYFNMFDAMVYFERMFFEKTGNKWSTKDSFKEKPGKYVMVRSDADKKLLLE